MMQTLPWFTAVAKSPSDSGYSQTINGFSVTGAAAAAFVNNSAGTPATLTVSGSTPGAFSGVIENTGGSTLALTQTGTGTLTLSGANTYSGNTTVSAGTLALSGSGAIASSPTITVASGATFDVSGLTTALSLGSGQTLSASATGANTTGTLTTGASKGLTLSAGGLTFTAYGGGATPPLTVAAGTGSLALNGAPVTVTTSSQLAAGAYKLIANSSSGGVTGTPGTLTVNGSGVLSGVAPTLQVVSGELWLYVPGISVAGSLSALTTTYGTASGSQNVTVSGAGLTGNITAAAPAGFQVSNDNSTWGSTATFTPSGGSASGTLYVRLAATAAVLGSYNSQNIALTSTGAATVNVATTSSGNAVNSAVLTYTANATSMTYGGTVPGLSGNVSGFVNSDTQAGATTGTLAFTTAATASSPAGSYAINGSGLTAANYTFVQAGANATALTIAQAAPSLTLTSPENPSGYRDSTSFTASLPADATGSVVFSSTNGPISTNGVNAGVATSLAITNLPRGTNVITVAYLGDGNYLGSTNNTLLQVVTNHPPVAGALTLTYTAGLPAEIALSDLATNWSDVDGDTVELTAINFTTTNGVALFPTNLTTNLDGSYVITNIAYLGYDNAANMNDQFSYSISDGQGGTNTGYVNLVVVLSVTGTNSIVGIGTGNPTALTAYGIPGYSYITERATNLAPAIWVDIATNTAATNGVINVFDTFWDLGSNQPAAAFYQLKWQQP